MSGKDFPELKKELDALNKTSPSDSPEDVYANYFFVYSIIYKQNVDKLSQKSMRRALKALIEYPLNAKDYHHTTEQEKNVILIGDKLLQAKQMMIMHVLAEQAKLQENKENEDGKETSGSRISGQEQGQDEVGLHQDQE